RDAITISGIVGTPSYMSPEQFLGEPVDRRSDIYSLGIVAYELLTGERPFRGDTTAIMYGHCNRELPPALSLNPRLNSAIEAVLHKATAKRRDARYSTAGAFAAALLEAVRQPAAPQVAPGISSAATVISPAVNPPTTSLPLADRLYQAALGAENSRNWQGAFDLLWQVEQQSPGYRDVPVRLERYRQAGYSPSAGALQAAGVSLGGQASAPHATGASLSPGSVGYTGWMGQPGATTSDNPSYPVGSASSAGHIAGQVPASYPGAPVSYSGGQAHPSGQAAVATTFTPAASRRGEEPGRSGDARRWGLLAALVLVPVVGIVGLFALLLSSGSGAPTPTVLAGAPTATALAGAGVVGAGATPTSAPTVAPSTPTAAPSPVPAALPSPAPTTLPPPRETAKIAVSLPKDSPATNLRESVQLMLNGIKLALARADNRAGIFAVTVDEWDNSNPTPGVLEDSSKERTNSERAVGDPAVLAYVGPYFDTTAEVSLPILNNAGILMIAPNVDRPDFTQPSDADRAKLNPTGRRNFLRIAPPWHYQAIGAARWAAGERLKSFYVVVWDRPSRFGRQLAERFTEEAQGLGLDFRGRETIGAMPPRPVEIAQKIKSQNVDVVYLSVDFRTTEGALDLVQAGQIARELRRSGVSARIVTSEYLRYVESARRQFVEEAGSNVDGVYFTGRVEPESLIGNPEGARWVQEYQSQFNSRPATVAAYASEAVNVILRALSQSGRKDREVVRQAAFELKDFNGLFGTYGFTGAGDPNMAAIVIYKLVGNQFETVDTEMVRR
ncbi:MAG: ABC transporter substrate-binding protein, partial [Chloroflexi bacterium]|nr:ABC transporter substrate-binding protein [Chloroflexota bacterium]